MSNIKEIRKKNKIINNKQFTNYLRNASEEALIKKTQIKHWYIIILLECPLRPIDIFSKIFGRFEFYQILRKSLDKNKEIERNVERNELFSSNVNNEVHVVTESFETVRETEQVTQEVVDFLNFLLK
ncbi:hypothetical protein BpHYR1_040538 [Brachionus plicatilis]|uniref:Uncharacterized protein n=1 Tax=Brachionus plicatilis TaxID=10195 RepID=A0A3M7PJH8_BRAPC|nr:hypothetical protein BpHYR1_040538 [Brachionus plicatilis]